MGELVEGSSRITIDYQSNWNGTLIWNCSGVPVGVYFIRISSNGNTRSIAVCVNNG
ncbi:MAG: hypothetical protein NT007_14270 [Candidatus Kapabacteria bacterium]|nr:hypothetical protein [Candidatus Kapabacteria bacterium]